MRKRKKKRTGFRLIHLLILAFVFWIGKTLIGQSIMIKDLDDRRIEEEAEIAQLEKEIQELNQEIESKDSLSFIEKTARERLRMVKPREIIYIDRNKGDGLLKFFNR